MFITMEHLQICVPTKHAAQDFTARTFVSESNAEDAAKVSIQCGLEVSVISQWGQVIGNRGGGYG